MNEMCHTIAETLLTDEEITLLTTSRQDPQQERL